MFSVSLPKPADFLDLLTSGGNAVRVRKWLTTSEREQPNFPPVVITNTLQVAIVKSFRNESFLREKYIDEGLTLDEIAALTLSS